MGRPKAAQTQQPRRGSAKEAWKETLSHSTGSTSQEYPYVATRQERLSYQGQEQKLLPLCLA